MKKYQIWIGCYEADRQAGAWNDKPEMVAEIESVSFRMACLKFELQRKLKEIEREEQNPDKHIDSPLSDPYRYDFNAYTISNDWSGRYYESEERAMGSCKNIKKCK